MTLKRLLKRWIRSEDGGATIELLFWFPVMVMMLMMTTDATLLMHQQQTMYNAARDASRQVALGQKNEDEAKAILVARLNADESNVTITQANGFVTTQVSLPFSDYAKISSFFKTGTLDAQVSMWVENYES